MFFDLKNYKIEKIDVIDNKYFIILDLTDIKNDLILNMSENDIILYDNKKLYINRVHFPLTYLTDKSNYCFNKQIEYLSDNDSIFDYEKINNMVSTLEERVNTKFDFKSEKLLLSIDAQDTEVIYSRFVILLFEIDLKDYSREKSRNILNQLINRYSYLSYLKDKNFSRISINFLLLMYSSVS